MKTIPCSKCDGTGKEPDHRAIGSELRKKRKEYGMSLRSLADALDVSAAYLSDLERGRRNWNGPLINRYKSHVGL